MHLGAAAHDAQAGAYAIVYRTVQGQAMALAYIDTYWLLAIGAAIMCCLSLFLKKNVAER